MPVILVKKTDYGFCMNSLNTGIESMPVILVKKTLSKLRSNNCLNTGIESMPVIPHNANK